jgi:uncharacterized protein
MSFDPFPERIEPRKLFARNGTVSGFIALGKLQRLCEYLSNKEGQIEVSLSFGRDVSNRRLLSGPINGTVHMLCQRCLKETSVSLHSELKVLVLSNRQWDEALEKSLPEDTEAVKMSDDEIDLDVTALIEDELILSLPIVAHHEELDCSKELNKLKVTAQANEVGSGNKAFAGLEVLKNKIK